MRNSTTAFFILVLPLASCAGAPPRTEDRLLAQIEQLAQLPGCRRAVLFQACALADPRLAEVGWQYRDDEDSLTRLYAWDVGLMSPAHRVERILEGLASDDRLIRRRCAEACGRSPELGHGVVDQALGKLMAQEQDGLTAEVAFRSFVQRNGRAGAEHVYEVVRARGAGWLPYAADALVLCPDEQFLDVFRAAADHATCQVAGRRGLSRLGQLGNEAWIADANRYGDEKSLQDYRDAYDAETAGLSGMRLGSIREMLGEAADARVVIIAERHHDRFVSSCEIDILQQLVDLWGGPARTRLLYEALRLQGLLITAAELLGCRTIACEEAQQDDFGDRPETRAWSLERRDAEAIETILGHAVDRDVRDLVVYGALHTTHIQEALRARGVPTMRIVLIPDAAMRAGAMRLVGSLKTLGKAFRYDDGTWFVDVIPYSSWDCPELDAKLGDEGR